MIDQRDKASTNPASGVEAAQCAEVPKRISRRALISGASVALPTVLTLNSNAAFGWAVTSGSIGTRAASPTATGDAVCVVGEQQAGAPQGVYAVDKSDLYQVRGDLYYRTGPGNSGNALSPEKVCEYKGNVYWRSSTSGSGTKVTKNWVGAVASVTHSGSMASLSVNGVYPDSWPL